MLWLLPHFLIGVFSIYMMGIARGGSKLKEKIAAKREQDFRKSVEIEREISDLNDTSLADRATEWVRDDKKQIAFCDIAQPIKFADREVIDHLVEHDRKLVVVQ